MTNLNKTLAALLVASTALTGVAQAEVSIEGNVGATTDYIWRGDTQSSGDASLSGGIDVDFGNGFAIGTWVGSLGGNRDENDDSANYELDLYGSYSTELSGVGVEVGYISYLYPGVADSGSDFADIYLGLSYGPASFTYFMLESAEDEAFEEADGTYMSLDLEFPLVQDWSIGLHYGLEENTLTAAEIAAGTEDSDEDTSVTLSKGDMNFTVSGDEGDDTRVIISWGTSF